VSARQGVRDCLFKTINRVDTWVDPYKFLICPLADKIIPVAVIPELNSGQALTKVSS
jgi:hypothetical protein